MPTITCPKCTISSTVDDDRLARPFYCCDCGGCLWYPAPAVPFVPAEQLEDSPPYPPPVQVPPAELPPRPVPPAEVTPPPRPRSSVAYVEPETPRRSVVPIVLTIVALMGLGYALMIGIVSVQASRNAAPKYAKKSSTPGNVKPQPLLSTPRDPDPDPEPPPPPPRTPSPESPAPTPTVRRKPSSNIRPTAMKEGAVWTPDELTAYLHGIGLTFTVSERFNKPDDLWIVSQEAGRVQTVMITRHSTPADARASAVADPAKSFAWGRFVLWGESSEFFRKVRSALAE